MSSDFSELVQREVNQILKGEQSERVNFSKITDFACNSCLNTNSSILDDYWVVDTGATCHICTVYNFFKDIRDLKEPVNVHMPDGNIRTTNKSGRVSLNQFMVLENVLYIPSFKFNLLSVGKVLKKGDLGCNFYGEFCEFQDLRTSRVIARGKLRGNLYVLHPKSFNHDENSCTANLFDFSVNSIVNSIVDVVTWHARLGHPSITVSKHLDPLRNKSLDNLLCDVCPLAKQTRQPFYDSHSTSYDFFDLLHANVWGPYRKLSLTGAFYFLTLVDDYSSSTWTFLMKNKFGTVIILRNFFIMT